MNEERGPEVMEPQQGGFQLQQVSKVSELFMKPLPVIWGSAGRGRRFSSERRSAVFDTFQFKLTQ